MNEHFEFSGSPQELRLRLEALGVRVRGNEYSTAVPQSGWAVQIPSDRCFETVDAYVDLAQVAIALLAKLSPIIGAAAPN